MLDALMRALRRPGFLAVCSLVAVCLTTSLATAAPPSSFRVEVFGHGPPMILIPELSASGDIWKTTVARYRDRFTCHILTLAGFAGVPAIDQPLVQTVRRDLAEYIRRERLQRPIVVGHGVGGTLALAVAADHPELVGPIVVVDGLPFPGGPALEANDAEEARRQAETMRQGLKVKTNTQWEDYLRSGALTALMATHLDDLERLKQWGLASDRRTVTDAMFDFYVLDLREDVARIASPVLVLGSWVGLHDQMASNGIFLDQSSVAQTFADQFAKLPRLHFEMSETSRHFIMFDAPQWLFGQLDAFVSNPEAVVRTRGFKGQ